MKSYLMKAFLTTLIAATVIYLAVVVYAQSTMSPTEYDAVIRAAQRTQEPNHWYTPEELGIIAIEDFGLNETWQPSWIRIAVKPENVTFLDKNLPTFKYKDSFWKISPLSVTLMPDQNSWRVPIGLVLGGGWIAMGVVYLSQRNTR